MVDSENEWNRLRITNGSAGLRITIGKGDIAVNDGIDLKGKQFSRKITSRDEYPNHIRITNKNRLSIKEQN